MKEGKQLSSTFTLSTRRCSPWGIRLLTPAIYVTCKLKSSTTLLLAFFICISAEACEPILDKRNLTTQLKESFAENEIIAIVHVEDVAKNAEAEFNTKYKVLEAFKGEQEYFETGWVAQCCLCLAHFVKNGTYIVHANLEKDGTYSIFEYGLSKELVKISSRELKLLRKYGS